MSVALTSFFKWSMGLLLWWQGQRGREGGRQGGCGQRGSSLVWQAETRKKRKYQRIRTSSRTKSPSNEITHHFKRRWRYIDEGVLLLLRWWGHHEGVFGLFFWSLPDSFLPRPGAGGCRWSCRRRRTPLGRESRRHHLGPRLPRLQGVRDVRDPLRGLRGGFRTSWLDAEPMCQTGEKSSIVEVLPSSLVLLEAMTEKYDVILTSIIDLPFFVAPCLVVLHWLK